jgi:hypothetical protein
MYGIGPFYLKGDHSMAEGRPLFKLEVNLRINRAEGKISVEDPTLINDKVLDQAWNTMNAFVMDLFDEKGIEPTDEQFREVLAEICFRIIYRELFTLFTFPSWEKSDLERLGTSKRGPYIKKKGSYDDSWY